MRKLFLLLLLIVLFSPVVAQETTSTIVGQITHLHGDVAAAVVKLTNKQNGSLYQTQSNSKGFYRIPNITPGQGYFMTVSSPNCKENRINDLTLYVGETLSVDILLSETDSVTTLKRVKKGLTTEEIKLIPAIGRDNIIKIFPQLTDQTAIITESTDQIAVLERFDVRDNDLSITTITKSGANKFTTTAYTYLSNEFKSTVVGAAIAGSIVKNKLFYYINADIERDNTNQTYDFSNYNHASYDDMLSLSRKTASYDMGSYTENGNRRNTTTISARMDWNPNERNKITITNDNRSRSEQKGDVSNNERIFFANSLTKSTAKINTTTFEVKSNSSPAVSNRFFLSLNTASQHDGYRGTPYPSVVLAKERITLGVNTQNRTVKESRFVLEDNIELNKGRHTVTIGTHNEFQLIKYNDRENSFGSYSFESLSDFVNGNRSPHFTQTYYRDEEVKLKRFLFSFYLQDIIRIKSNFTLTYGVRLESHGTINKPKSNEQFNEKSAQLLNGTATGQKASPTLGLLPRVSFDWMINAKLRLHGGFGLFSTPSHYQDIIGTYQHNGQLYEKIGCDTGIDFSPDFNRRYPTDSPTDIRLLPYDVHLLDKKLKSPTHLKTRIETHYTTTSDFVISLLGTYSKTIHGIMNEDLRLMETERTVTGSVGDNRPIYEYNHDEQLNSYNDIYYTTNTTKGYYYNLTFSLYKDFRCGLSTFVAYNYNNKNNIRALISYKLDYTSTLFSLFYEGGHRTSYSLTANNQLLYIPLDKNDINIIDKIEENMYSKEQQWDELNKMINDNSHLRKNRGTILKENSIHSPWENSIDFRITQKITLARDHKLELSLDAMNRSSSKMYQADGVNYDILNLEGYESDGTTPRYTVNRESIKKENELSFTKSWKFQLGIRYIF